MKVDIKAIKVDQKLTTHFLIPSDFLRISNPLHNHSATRPKQSYNVFKSFNCLIREKSMILRYGFV